MDRRTFLAAGTVAAGAGLLNALPAAAQQPVLVRSLEELQRALDSAVPGAVITVANGTYAGPPVLIKDRHGTPSAPITVRAQSPAGVVLTGAQSFVFGNSSNVTISGFAFRQSTTLEIPPDCSRIRLSRNDFQLADIEGLHWLMVRADHSVVERNAFHGKSTLGIYLGVEGAGSDGMAQGVHIVRNHFTDHTFTGSNGGEPIRLGVSPRALTTAGAVVEFNLFERANGDPEAISVKSSGNLIRMNTIRDSVGGIVLRHGNRNQVEHNLILDGKNGIRIYGDDHRIADNFVHKIAGSGIVLGSGNVRDHFVGESPSSRRGNDAPDRVLITRNGVVDCGTAISGESHRTLPPLGCTISDNLLVGHSGQLVRMPYNDGITWSGNRCGGRAETGDIPPGGFTRIDRMGSGSRPLTAADVGPYAS